MASDAGTGERATMDKRKCIICREREAVVPDRYRMGAPVKRVCRECHADRLRADLRGILEAERREGDPNGQ